MRSMRAWLGLWVTGAWAFGACGDESAPAPDTNEVAAEVETVEAEATSETAEPETSVETTEPGETVETVEQETVAETTPETVVPEVTPEVVEVTPEVGDAETDSEVEPTPLEPLFTTRAVHQVAITLAPEDWAALRLQERSRIEMFTGACQAAPHVSPFTYFRGDLTIDGVTVSEVGVRKKGWLGSVESNRPSLKLKLDKYVAGQAIAGLDDLTLNNARQDRSLMKQCLGYALFAAAGVASPGCGFARVTVNGEDLGVYVVVEPVDGDFLDARFVASDGNMYEGVFSDFRASWLGSFEPETNEDTTDKSDLAALAHVLASDLAGDALLAALEPLVDIDAFVSFWAMESLIAHRDGYASRGNNFHVYGDPATGRFVFFPHGIDQTMDEELLTPATMLAYSDAILPRRLLDIASVRERYFTRLQALLDEVWDVPALHAEIDAMYQVLLPFGGPDADDAELPGSLRWASDRLRSFIAQRPTMVADALEAGLVPGTLRDTVCMRDVGTFEASFESTFGSLPFGPKGTATMAIVYQGTPVVLRDFESRVGTSGSRAFIKVAARDGDNREWRLDLFVDGGLFQPSTFALDWVHDSAQLYGPVNGITSNIAEVGPATLTFEAAEAVPGATIRGTLRGTLHAR